MLTTRHKAHDLVQRALDLVVALAALTVLSPVIVAVALAVRRNLGSPVLFVQQRPGKAGRLFPLYKFRTLTDARDESGALLSDAERMTSFGARLRASSLDELPQLVNILKGDMSLVGPRPLLPEYLPLYSPRQARRHEVRPGITGLAQVSGRNAISWEERFELDVRYVDERSCALDARILLETVAAALSREGVTAQGHVTMEPFTGDRSATTEARPSTPTEGCR